MTIQDRTNIQLSLTKIEEELIQLTDCIMSDKYPSVTSCQYIQKHINEIREIIGDGEE